MSRIPQFATALGLVATIVATPALASEPDGFEGVYVATGPDGTGADYNGFVRITRHGDSFLVAWLFPRYEGQTSVLEIASMGVGVASEGALAVSYYGAWITGVALYRRSADGHLSGTWTVAAGDGRVYSETLIRLSAGTAPDLAAPTVPPPPVSAIRPSGRVL